MILIIENRKKRQEKHISFNINEYSNIVKNCIDEAEYTKLLDEFCENSFDNLDKYNVICIHFSMFEKIASTLQSLEKYCKDNGKHLVQFTGDYESSMGQNIIKSTDFYSDNLKLFFNDYKNHHKIFHLPILWYGKSWKLNILLDILETINILLENSDKWVFDGETKIWIYDKEDIKLDLIKNSIDFEDMVKNLEENIDEEGYIEYIKIKEFSKKLTIKIKEKVVFDA